MNREEYILQDIRKKNPSLAGVACQVTVHYTLRKMQIAYKSMHETEQMVPKSMTDKYVLSEVVLLEVDSSNVVSGCYNLQYGLLKKGRE